MSSERGGGPGRGTATGHDTGLESAAGDSWIRAGGRDDDDDDDDDRQRPATATATAAAAIADHNEIEVSRMPCRRWRAVQTNRQRFV